MPQQVANSTLLLDLKPISLIVFDQSITPPPTPKFSDPGFGPPHPRPVLPWTSNMSSSKTPRLKPTADQLQQLYQGPIMFSWPKSISCPAGVVTDILIRQEYAHSGG